MDQILEAFKTGGGMLWQALWALIFGYIISAGIQVLITREQMADALGERGVKGAGRDHDTLPICVDRHAADRAALSSRNGALRNRLYLLA